MTTNSLRRPLLIFMIWIGIIVAWGLWLASGPPGALKLHRWLMWNKFPNEFVENVAFAPASNMDGSFELISLRDLQKYKTLSFQPLPNVLGKSSSFEKQVVTFYGSNEDHSWDPSASLTELDSNSEGTRYEVVLRYPDGNEWRWRYRANRERVVPLEWYRLRDTAGIMLIPLTLLTWLIGLPIAIWTSRRLSQFTAVRFPNTSL